MSDELAEFTQLIFERKNELLALNEAIGAAKRSGNSTPEKIVFLDEICRLKNEQTGLEKDVAAKKEELSRKTQELDYKKIQLVELENKYISDRQRKEDELDRIGKQIEFHVPILERQNNDIIENKKTVLRLEQQINDKQDELSRKNTEVSKLLSDFTRLTEKNSELESKRSAFVKENSELEAENKTAKSELEEVENKLTLQKEALLRVIVREQAVEQAAERVTALYEKAGIKIII